MPRRHPTALEARSLRVGILLARRLPLSRSAAGMHLNRLESRAFGVERLRVLTRASRASRALLPAAEIRQQLEVAHAYSARVAARRLSA